MTPWTAVLQSPLSIGILWSVLPCPLPGDPQYRNRTQVSHIAGGFFTHSATRKAQLCFYINTNIKIYFSVLKKGKANVAKCWREEKCIMVPVVFFQFLQMLWKVFIKKKKLTGKSSMAVTAYTNFLVCPKPFQSHPNLSWQSKLSSLELPWWSSGWTSACQCGGHRFDPWSGKIPQAAEQLSLCATTDEPTSCSHRSPHA